MSVTTRPLTLIGLQETLTEQVREAELYERLPDGKLLCYACGHRCKIPEGRAGVCRIRFNQDGKLMSPWGYVGSLQVDPIEKKPFWHAYPGVQALSFGMLGCDFRCGYCQNWLTSQALRDPEAVAPIREITPERLVDLALRNGCRVITTTYNEPLITSEWAVDVFREAKKRGLVCSFVSNGNGTPEVLDYLQPWVELYKVDLKSFSDRSYRRLGGRLQPVLDTIQGLVDRGFWVEVVTLVVPGFNDSEEELRQCAEFLAGVSRDIPWHVTGFHSEYKMEDTPNTTPDTLRRAVEIGEEAGLRFVYSGNLPGMVGNTENSYCPDCKELLIERLGFTVRQNRLAAGCCPKCRATIPGRWE